VYGAATRKETDRAAAHRERVDRALADLEDAEP
jgi:hypothetical protein